MTHTSHRNVSQKITCWVASEGLAGTESQCLGVADALGVTPVIKRIKLRQPWKSLSPYLKFEQSFTFSPALALAPPWPDLLITSGRKSIAVSRYIKKMSAGKTFTVQIQDPRTNPAQFDLVVVPEHDPLSYPQKRTQNVIVTKASPNRVTAEKLQAAKQHFPQFGKLNAPRVAVLIGGTRKSYRLTSEITQRLATQLSQIDAQLMITTSRRTGVENERILKETLCPDHYLWDGEGNNPYFALLAYADYILVTADSASMLSEACTTGKPVYMISMDGSHARIDKLHKNLRQSGCLRDFEGILEPWHSSPLNDAARVADEIRKHMNL